MSAVAIAFCAGLAVLALQCWRYRQSANLVSNHPGLRVLVSPMSMLGLLLPALPFPYLTYPGFTFPWDLKYRLFSDYTHDTISLVAYLPNSLFSFLQPHALIYTADPTILSRIGSFASRETFIKPVEQYEQVLGYFGNNLVICEGESWKRQRRIGQPAFSRRMLEGLWIDMRNIFDEMVKAEKWEERTTSKEEIYVGHVVDLTLRMALAAIARAGFGMDFEWSDGGEDHKDTSGAGSGGDGFTAYCQAFGRPRRWKWWLHVLQAFHDLSDYWPCWFPSLTPYMPSPIQWIADELWTAFERPTAEDWSDTPKKMRVQEALHLVAKDSVLRLALPKWMLSLPIRRIRRMSLAFDTLERELGYLADERKIFYAEKVADTHLEQSHVLAAPVKQRTDLLNNLVRAAMLDEGEPDLETGKGKKGLTDGEIIGNTYIYFLAGHETTAHSLAWTLALLAAYPEHQQTALEEIRSVMASGITAPTLDDYEKFPFVLACYLETLRLFPPVMQIPKLVAADTTLPMPVHRQTNEKASWGEKKEAEVVVKKGTFIMLDTPGVHYHPRYWEEPEKFDPSRFTKNGGNSWHKDAFIPFGIGHRACLGRKFSEVESVSMLVHLLRDWEVLLPASDRQDVEEARRRFSRAYVRITLTPVSVPLVFRRRT